MAEDSNGSWGTPNPYGNDGEQQAPQPEETQIDVTETITEETKPTQAIPVASQDSAAPGAASAGTTPTDTAAGSAASGTSSAGTEESSANGTPVDGTYRLAPQYGAFSTNPAAHGSAQPASAAGTPGTGSQQTGQQSQSQPTQQFGTPYGASYGQSSTPNGNYFPPTQNPSYGNAYGASNANNANANAGGANGTPTGPAAPNGPQQGMPGGVPMPPNANANARPRTASNVVVAVVAALVAAALCLGFGYAALTNGWVKVATTSSLTSVSSNKSGTGSATVDGGDAPDWTSVINNVSDSVVSIQTTLSNGTAKGSGAIIDKAGYIITNNHVVEDATAIQVTLANGDMYSATTVGTDQTTDLAVLKLDNAPDNLTAVTFADSDNLAAGEPILAIGNPLGYEGTSTSGIISALNRPVSVMDSDNTAIVTNAVQIDAAINPGNSGGPTFNAAGQVIGINSSIASTASSTETAGSIGIGFAIPSNLVKRVAEEIIKNGKVVHVALGVTITATTVEADGVTRGGALIKSVVSGGPAAKAGLKAGDTIVAFNGNAVSNNYSLLGYVRAAALDSTAKLTVVRDGKTLEFDVTFDQEESDVNGTTRNDNSGNSGNSGNSNGDSNGNSNGDSGSGNGNGGGFTDPFGLW